VFWLVLKVYWLVAITFIVLVISLVTKCLNKWPWNTLKDWFYQKILDENFTAISDGPLKLTVNDFSKQINSAMTEVQILQQ
jgi:hypothetical protein